MLLLYTEKQTNRLGYTLKLVFKELLGLDYVVTTDKEYFLAFCGAKISYSEGKIGDELHIEKANNLLFDTTIKYIEVDYFEDNKGVGKIFKNYTNECGGYDILGATFYMVSRYEEYLPFISDEHQRFSFQNSFALKNNFLEKPIVNIWVKELKGYIKEKYPTLEIKEKEFSFLNTIDIDQAYKYRHKGWYRTIGCIGKNIRNRRYQEIKQNLLVLLHREKDAWDCFDWIISQIEEKRLPTIYFVLFGYYNKYDKNINIYNSFFRSLIKKISINAQIGIHPSYYSMENIEGTIVSKKTLESCIHKKINCSRFHYLRFLLPDSYSDLIDCGITDDYSMGYSNCVGFRAGICCSYNFYDLDKDCETKLRIHPFEVMDVALKNGMKLDTIKAKQKIKQIIDQIVEVGGEYISVWHNESLGNEGEWEGWREVYKWQIEYIEQKINK